MVLCDWIVWCYWLCVSIIFLFVVDVVLHALALKFHLRFMFIMLLYNIQYTLRITTNISNQKWIIVNNRGGWYLSIYCILFIATECRRMNERMDTNTNTYQHNRNVQRTSSLMIINVDKTRKMTKHNALISKFVHLFWIRYMHTLFLT